MHQSVLRILPVLLFLTLLSAPGSSARLERPIGRVPLHLEAAVPVLHPVGEGQTVVPRIPGFGFNRRPGEPMLPLKIHLVAIPEGSEPRLRIVAARTRPLEGVDVAPVPHLRLTDRGAEAGLAPRRPGTAGSSAERVPVDYRDLFEPDRAIYGGGRPFPGAPVRLGAVGYLREQRFVEVIHTPVLYDPVARRATHYLTLDVEIDFSEPEGAAARAFRPDPHFESLYESAFVNYEQGKRYRTGRGSGPRQIPAATSTSSLSIAAANGVPRYKISVSRSGIYRLDHAYLSLHAAGILGFDPRTWVLSAEGVDLPIAIRSTVGGAGEADGQFDADDVLEFYGREKSGPPTVLNYDFPGTFPDVYQTNDFTDTQVYWLTSVEPAGSHPRIPEADGAPVNGWPQPADFEATAVWEEDDVFFPLGDSDPYFALPDLLAGGLNDQRDLVLALPGLASADGDAEMSIRLRGGSSLSASPDHRTLVEVNGDSGSAADFTWDGEVIHQETFNVPHATLADPSTIHVELPGQAGVNVDRQYLDTISVRYRRAFDATGDRLEFVHPNEDSRFAVDGFSGPSALIYDISRTIAGTDEPDPVRITGASLSGSPDTIYTFEVPLDPDGSAPALRAFSVAGPTGLLLPDGMEQAADPVLADPTLEADMIVIASRDAIDPAPGGALDDLLQHRQATQGLSSRIVYMDQIADEFGFGLPGPEPIRTFLAWAYDNWRGQSGQAAPPSFVLLVGDATADTGNRLGRGDWIYQVPSPIMIRESTILGYYSSDNYLAAFRGGDQLADLSLGRITTRTPAESDAVFQKILSYEQAPPAGPWKGHIVLTTGEGKVPGESDSFEAIQNEMIATYFSEPPFTTPDPPLYFAQPPWNETDAAGFNAALIDELEVNGTSWLSFVGHGAFDLWGLKTFFRHTDADALQNGTRLPFMVNVNCLTGGFHWIPQPRSLAESMTNNPSGGAIASLAPSGLSNLFVGGFLAGGLYEPIFGPGKERVLGVAAQTLRTSLFSIGSIVDMQSFTYLGDPATVLAIPAPPPPGSLSATAGNGEVDLTWTAPAAPADGVRIYRSARQPTGPYEPIPCDVTGATSCVDREAINATTYYYYAVSLDIDGFEGRASNFNTDCDAGPDCVSATPINSGPPSVPAGLAVDNPGTGGRLDVSWQPNTEDDLQSYTLYYGTVSKMYDVTRTIGVSEQSTALTGLVDGTPYYIALSATNTSGFESALSDEVIGVPRLFLGIAPPRAIADLDVTEVADDLLLTWSRPTENIFGGATTVVRYQIHRSGTPAFLPSLATQIAQIDDGAQTTFLDPGAAGMAGSLHYLVRAIDDAGLASGIGRELPNGVSSLTLTDLGGGMVRLSWSPITTDLLGRPTLIDHYQVHAGPSPIPRASLGPATLLVDNVGSLSVDLSAPDNLLFFSVIAVDNRGNLSPF